MKKYLFILITFFGIFKFSQTKEKELIIVQNLTLENFKIEELIKFVNSNIKSENEKAKLGNVTPNSAYQQIANALLNNRAIEERNNLINKISEENNVEEVAKEYTEAE